MLIYISIVRIEMPNKSNNILNVSQIDLRFAYTLHVIESQRK